MKLKSTALWIGTVSLIALWIAGQFTQPNPLHGQESTQTQHNQPRKRLAVVWTSGDPEVAHRVCLMYTHAAKSAGWFDEVQLIVWGPSARLLAADKDIQAKVQEMAKSGIQLKACVVCADSYGVSDRLRELGLEVKPMGKPLTDLLQSGWTVLTY